MLPGVIPGLNKRSEAKIMRLNVKFFAIDVSSLKGSDVANVF